MLKNMTSIGFYLLTEFFLEKIVWVNIFFIPLTLPCIINKWQAYFLMWICTFNIFHFFIQWVYVLINFYWKWDSRWKYSARRFLLSLYIISALIYLRNRNFLLWKRSHIILLFLNSTFILNSFDPFLLHELIHLFSQIIFKFD